MAEIDQDVQSLLSILMEASLAPLGELVLARLLDEEAIRAGREDSEEGTERMGWPQGVLSDEMPRERAVRQLEFANRVIVNNLKRQLSISTRLRELAPELGLSSVRIAPRMRDSETAARPGGADLLSVRRNQAIERFLKAWNVAQSELKQRWARRDAG